MKAYARKRTKLTVKELAADVEFADVFRGVNGVYRAVRDHGLPCVKPMGVLLFDRTEVRAWVEQSRCNVPLPAQQQDGSRVLFLNDGKVAIVK